MGILKTIASKGYNFSKRATRPLYKNRLTFRYSKKKHYEAHKPDYDIAKNLDDTKKLIKDGFIIKESFLSTSQVDSILDDYNESLTKLKNGRYDGQSKNYYWPEKGFHRLYLNSYKNSDLHNDYTNNAAAFLDSDYISNMAKSYLGNESSHFGGYIEYKCNIGKDKSYLYHTDHWKQRFKAFLYLTDVTEAHAPLYYLKGSHSTFDDWRFDHEYKNCYVGKSYGTIDPSLLKSLKKNYGYEEICCTAKRGTLIIADVKGAHRGSHLKEGNIRIHMLNQFRNGFEKGKISS